MSDVLGRLRVLCGRLGLDQTTFAHLPPDEEERALTDFAEGVAVGLEATGMSLDDYLRAVDPTTGRDDPKILRLSSRSSGLSPRGRAR